MKVTILVSLVLVGTLLVSAFLVGITSSASVYNPWYDLDDNGKIDIFDIVRMAGAYGTSGTPYEAKAALEYGSGWINITDKAGQYFNVTHNMGSTDVMVDITGKMTPDGEVHQRYLGGTDFVAGWNKTYGGTAQDQTMGVIKTADGGYLFQGFTRSFGAGQSDFLVVKTDSLGNIQWSKTYGTAALREEANWAIQTSDGGYAIVGNKGIGDFDIWLVKTDAFGNMQWNKTYGGGAYEFTCKHGILQTSDEGYVIAGRTRSFAVGQEDFWLLRTDANGNMLWNKVYGGIAYDGCTSMVQTSDGGYALLGWTDTPHGIWLVKTNSTGYMQWSQTLGGDNAYQLIVTNDGGFAIAGFTTLSGAGGQDFYLVKTDSSGVMEWSKTYGGTADDAAMSLIQLSSGGYVLAGNTRSYGAGDVDVWVIWTDAVGTMQFSKTYGGSAEEYAGGTLIQSYDGGLMMAFDTKSFGAGNFDWWLIKTDAAGNAVDGFKYGLAWTDSTADTVTLYRGTDDAYWNYVRVRVWVIK
jgi:hypothetical protein